MWNFDGLRATLFAGFALVTTVSWGVGPARSQDPRPSRVEVDAFAMRANQNAVWTPETYAIEKTKSDARQQKIERLLALLAEPGTSSRADLYFRLAETRWQEATYTYSIAAQRYDQEYSCWDERRCPSEPREPTPDFAAAIWDYRKVLSEEPNYPRRDQVFYNLGRTLLELGERTQDRALESEGERYLLEVTEKYPESTNVAQSHLLLAERYFDRDALGDAETHYLAFIRGFPTHALSDYAHYKLAWLYYLTDRLDQSVDTFKRVVSSAERSASLGTIEFRTQALDDLLHVYANLAGGWRLAREYYVTEVGEDDAYRRLVRLAMLLADVDKYEEAIALYQELIAHDPTSPDNVAHFGAIMGLRRMVSEATEIDSEIDEMADFFAPKGRWMTANSANRDATSQANDLVTTNLKLVANDYHDKAQDMEGAGKDVEESYTKAAEYYRLLLSR